MIQFGLLGLGTPAGDIAKQLPVLLAANERDTAIGLLRGQTSEMLTDISNRAIALYDVDPAVMAELVADATAGQPVVATVPLTKAAAAVGVVMTSFKSPPKSVWAVLLGVAVIGGGVGAYRAYKRKPRGA